ncbi:MAG: alpha/beta fold hydrolase [Bacteroidota bacterium]
MKTTALKTPQRELKEMSRQNASIEKMIVQQEEVQIKCADGFILAGTLYEPGEVKGAVLVAPATGIKRRFYHAFSSFLAQNGYAALAFENRGIGDSKRGDINSGNPSLHDWGKLDMAAALELLQERYPDIKYHLVGHSAGGQLVGLMNNAQDLTSIFNFGCSSGSINNATYPYKFAFHFWINFVIPVSNFLFGHVKSQWFGMGEPLPKKVASDWSRYCNGSGYVKVDLNNLIQHHWYDQLKIPSLWLHATDDQIANLANVKDMIRVYSKLKYEIITLEPGELGFQEIGHMGFFSSKKKSLWKYAIDWLNQQ